MGTPAYPPNFAPSRTARAKAFVDAIARRAAPLRPFEPALYTLWAGAVTLASVRVFYGYMLKQTGGEWSAPLDDVFIHFDYARSIALGHPFEWVPGNGFSSGNTSILYPFVLAAGYLVGFTGPALMVWAAIVASTCTFATLLVARGLFFRTVTGAAHREGFEHDDARDGWARASSYLLPPMFLGIGALDWSLWSGMEVAFFLATWAGALSAFLRLEGARDRDVKSAAWSLGAWGVVMVLTRPEAALTIAVFGIAAAVPLYRRLRLGGAVALLLRVGSPAAVAMALQSAANRYFTGEWSANGALVKLAVNNPFLTRQEKLDDYLFNFKYTIFRNTEYHFTDAPAYGVVVPALALLALAVPRTRRVAIVLWSQLVLWLAMVSLNGQVRWQNERYTMPAVAWLLVLAALGVSGLLRSPRGPRAARLSPVIAALGGAVVVQLVGIALRPGGTLPEIRLPWALALGAGAVAALALSFFPVRAVAVIAALFVAHEHQVPRMRDQKWFFGRASRNIRDQHVTAGRFLAKLGPKRVLVGDAGALMYASELPGLDIIGLGGFRELPFARAGVQGLPATIELMERVPKNERPDVFAIYPTWWGILPTWFSSHVIARFPVEGNVICGGYEKVIYAADWHVLGTGEAPRSTPAGESVRDSVDVSDLVSEKEHAYVFPTPAGGWTDMKILRDPADATRDLFDGGRRIAGGRAERFTLRGLENGRVAHLIVRSAPDGVAHVRVRIDGADVATVDFAPTEGWVEEVVVLPASAVNGEMHVELVNDGPSDFIDYHVWSTQ